MLARFIRAYGMDTYHNPARWPTRDGVIPFKLFFLLSTALWYVEAEEQLRETLAYTLGRTVVDGKKGKAKTQLRNLSRRAFPEVL